MMIALFLALQIFFANASELVVFDLVYGSKTVIKAPKNKAVRFDSFLIRCRDCISETLSTGHILHLGFFEIWEILEISGYPKLIFSSWISSDFPFGYKRYEFKLKGKI